MPDNVPNNEPAPKPVRTVLPPFKTIIEDGNKEIGRRARALVDLTLDTKQQVDPKWLRQLGDDGTRYFFKRLKARVSERVSAAAATRAATAVSATAAANRAQGSKVVATAIAKAKLAVAAVVPKSGKGPVVTVVNSWRAKQRHRSSFTTTAIARGLLIAFVMVVGAIIVLRLIA